MDAAIKTQWLEALRSGKYQQCQGQLKNIDRKGAESFCCLGVLAQIGGGVQVVSQAQYLEDTCGVPMWVQKELAQLNDSGGKDFNFIADYIDKEIS